MSGGPGLWAITLTQPWASLVSFGAKRIETRSWSTSHRGTLLIHAAKGFPVAARKLCLIEPFASALRAGGVPPAVWTDGQDHGGAEWSALPLGAIVAAVDTVDCVRTEDTAIVPEHSKLPPYRRSADLLDALVIPASEQPFGDYSNRRFAWVFDRVRRLPTPVPCRGRLGLWDVPNNVGEAVCKSLGV